jgi:toxin YoeB
MRLLWTREALEDYQHWQRTDPKLVVAINALIDDIGMNDPFKGLGKPEPLKHSLKGWWSRRITREHRLVYRGVAGKGAAQQLEIAACRYHY